MAATARTIAVALAGRQRKPFQILLPTTTKTSTIMRSFHPWMLGASYTLFSTTTTSTTTHTHGFQQPLLKKIETAGRVREATTIRTTTTNARRRCVRMFSSSSSSSSSSSTSEMTTSDDGSFATSYHAPVMWKECIQGLLDCQRSRERQEEEDKEKENKSLVFVDGTLGGGGHSAALLEQLQPGDVLIGCDVDPNALETASSRLEAYMTDGTGAADAPTFIPVQSNFGNLTVALNKVLHPSTGQPITVDGVDGILLDLGVSSFQIDTPERGFAFMKDGPLDMRMNAGGGGSSSISVGLTAADICNEFDERELQRIFSVYGDEPKSKTVAKAIVKHRPLKTTGELVSAIASVTPKFAKSKRMGQTATCARIFQSLRIVVNNEDGVLEQVLSEVCPTLIRPGGRLVVLSYHSMEDRATKRIMRDGTLKKLSRTHQQDQRDIYGNYKGPPKPFKPVGKRRKATEEEIALNSRARSASLRIADRQEER